ncbi:HPr-rel-A system PqqD family peptide chaperone [Desulfacinum infernum]|nr:HPr-rel-A system PqqD family peptide chaperone [Desulfacinum infernum]
MENGKWRLKKVKTNRYDWDQTVLFHELSGDTHILSPIAEAVLDFLENGPAAAPEIIDRICNQLDLERTKDLEDQLMALLRDMDESGLIERTFP